MLLDSYRSVNAVAKAFWARMQTELLDRQRWRTRVELTNAIFEYIEGVYNRRRCRCAGLAQLRTVRTRRSYVGPDLLTDVPVKWGQHQEVSGVRGQAQSSACWLS
jgi:transposase InsO family protein